MELTSLRQALQEWDILVQALALGQCTVLVRKGGIHEKLSALDFTQKTKPAFCFLPSFEHQELERLSPNLRNHVTIRSQQRPRYHRLTHWATLEHASFVDDLEDIVALGTMLPWSHEELEKRFYYRGKPGLYVWLVRIYALREMEEISDQKSFHGCRSWINLGDELQIAQSEAVIQDVDFAELRKEFHRHIKGSA